MNNFERCLNILQDKEILNEIHYTDLYPKDFNSFYEKWKKKDVIQSGDYFVNFTNYAVNDKVNIDDKSINMNQDSIDHSDPSGLYCYPLKYVIEHPADIWYGRNAKFLRVIQIIGKPKILHLQNMSSANMYNIVNSLNLSESYITLAKKHYSCNEKQAVFKLTQVANPQEFFKKKKSYYDESPVAIIKTAKEQNEFWQSMGYDILMDEARNQKSAIINDREPLQIIFLNKKYLKIVDFFELRTRDDYIAGSLSSDDEKRMKRKLAGMISTAIDDKINDAYKDMFWTKKGRQITITIGKSSSYYTNKKLGEKPHKANKKFDENIVDITIISERKQLEIYDNIPVESDSYTYSSIDETFIQIVNKIKKTFFLGSMNDKFIPEYTYKEYKKKEDKKQELKKQEYKISLIKRRSKDIEQLCQIYHITWDSNLTDEEWYHVYKEYEIRTFFEKDAKFLKSANFNTSESVYTDVCVLQMRKLLDVIYNDNTEITIINREHNIDVKWGDEYTTTILKATKKIKLNDNFIFAYVLDWKIK